MPSLLGGTLAALKAGYAYGETMELALPEVVDLKHAPARSARSRMTSGTDAMALGVAAAGALAERPVFYCSYPITPASALLHALAKLKAGVRPSRRRTRSPRPAPRSALPTRAASASPPPPGPASR